MKKLLLQLISAIAMIAPSGLQAIDLWHTGPSIIFAATGISFLAIQSMIGKRISKNISSTINPNKSTEKSIETREKLHRLYFKKNGILAPSGEQYMPAFQSFVLTLMGLANAGLDKNTDRENITNCLYKVSGCLIAYSIYNLCTTYSHYKKTTQELKPLNDRQLQQWLNNEIDSLQKKIKQISSPTKKYIDIEEKNKIKQECEEEINEYQKNLKECKALQSNPDVA